MRRMHHIWPGQHWPMSARQEAAAVSELIALADAPRDFDRDDVSALVGILRCGASWERVLELAPGLDLCRLLGAYRALDKELSAVRAAWLSIVRTPTAEVLAAHADQAARLLPVPVHRALFAMEDSPSHLPAAIAELEAQLERAAAATATIERRLERMSAPSPAGVTLGETLFSTIRPGLYADPFFLAERVGALSPVRIAELLSEPAA